MGVKLSDKVTTVSHTFTATLSAIRYLGAYNEFVDIDEKTVVWLQKNLM